MGSSATDVAPVPAGLPPPLEALLGRFGGGPVKDKDLRALHRWLSSLTLTTPFHECAAALETGARWVHAGVGATGEGGESLATTRLRILLDVLDMAPVWRRTFAYTAQTLLQGTTALPLFESGLPNDRGLFDETSDRLAHRLLPMPRDERDLGEHLGRWFPKRRDAEWIASIEPHLVARLSAIVAEGVDAWHDARQSLLDAVALVAARTSALGLSRDMRARSPEVALAASPFFLLPRLCDALLDGIGSAAACRDQIADCRAALTVIHDHLEEFGVSIDVVYRIDVCNRNLDRLAELLAVVEARDPDAKASAVCVLTADLIRARAREGSLRDLIRDNVRLLARKIIERAGETGEHYITATRREYWKMIASAGGGGLLTVGTTYFKYLVMGGGFAHFIEGFLAGLNYAISFVVMQLAGFTLATKQPSMTAAALAGAIKESSGDLDELVTVIARINRSQLAAAASNVVFCFAGSVLFNYLYVRSTGHPFLDEHAAQHTLESFHPLHSKTIWFAALTGVILWMSSLGAGWLENWAAYRRLFDGIAEHRLGRVFGRRTMRWLSRKLHKHIAGFGGNITLGFMLGLVPAFGKFLGLPLEVRHVTLSSGGLAMSVCTLGLDAPGVFAAACGIGCMLVLNFGVSFALALGVAVRARGVEHAGLRLLAAVLKRLVRSPGEFFFPSAS
jgi:site-specific recombinase